MIITTAQPWLSPCQLLTKYYQVVSPGLTSAMMTEVSAGSSLTEELVRQEGADTDLTRVLMAVQNIIKIIR